jgi:hypothetical protein
MKKKNRAGRPGTGAKARRLTLKHRTRLTPLGRVFKLK